MKKTITLKENREFRRLYARGKFYSDKNISVYILRTKIKQKRLGLTVSTKIGKAVIRNRIKRKFREVYRLYEDKFPDNTDMVIVARPKILEAQFSEICTSFEKALKRLFTPNNSDKNGKKN